MLMFSRINEDNFNMTKDYIIDLVWNFPFFTEPDTIAMVDSNGIVYTGKELCAMAGIKILSKEEL